MIGHHFDLLWWAWALGVSCSRQEFHPKIGEALASRRTPPRRRH
jgi:hypothetical protein